MINLNEEDGPTRIIKQGVSSDSLKENANVCVR